MKRIHQFYSFFTNGIRTFRTAATGNYRGESDAVRQIREEMMAVSPSDSAQLRRDRKNIERDIRISYNKLIAANG